MSTVNEPCNLAAAMGCKQVNELVDQVLEKCRVLLGKPFGERDMFLAAYGQEEGARQWRSTRFLHSVTMCPNTVIEWCRAVRDGNITVAPDDSICVQLQKGSQCEVLRIVHA